ncbi:hypothetical protein BC833DRAFT_626256 [Globomyces pollinis-pini]|nr:hypothetical protein BC833DRAFT_626256 [Globomyces pollinis-pini]
MTVLPMQEQMAVSTRTEKTQRSCNIFSCLPLNCFPLFPSGIAKTHFREYQKCDSMLKKQKVDSTVVIFGGSRLREYAVAKELFNQAQLDYHQKKITLQVLKATENILKFSKYYDEAVKIGAIVGRNPHFATICTGGGPGIMEAASKGAYKVNQKSVSLTIELPFEQDGNKYCTPSLEYSFKNLSVRKMQLVHRAKAMICFPGGFGTLDELFEVLTLIQNDKIKHVPIILFGKDFWLKLINFEFLVERGLISPKDLGLFHLVENADEAWETIRDFYSESITLRADKSIDQIKSEMDKVISSQTISTF